MRARAFAHMHTHACVMCAYYGAVVMVVVVVVVVVVVGVVVAAAAPADAHLLCRMAAWLHRADPSACSCGIERLAEYAWKPHRIVAVQTNTLQVSTYRYMRNTTGGYSFIEFEISSSTISTVFRQPLKYAASAPRHRARKTTGSLTK